MTARETRLERRLCERERELIRAEYQLNWYRERWLAVAFRPGLADEVANIIRCKRAGARRAAA